MRGTPRIGQEVPGIGCSNRGQLLCGFEQVRRLSHCRCRLMFAGTCCIAMVKVFRFVDFRNVTANHDCKRFPCCTSSLHIFASCPHHVAPAVRSSATAPFATSPRVLPAPWRFRRTSASTTRSSNEINAVCLPKCSVGFGLSCASGLTSC